MKDLRSDEGINQVPGILWPFSTVINPAVNLGQLCPSEDGSRVFSGCPGHLGKPVSSPCHVPQYAGTLRTDRTCEWVMKGEPQCTGSP